MMASAEARLGLASVLSYQSAEAIAAGRLVPVLTDHAPPPMPVSLLCYAGRAAMPAVRVFIEAIRDSGWQGAWDYYKIF